MKVYICPICGDRLIETGDIVKCDKCEHEVIPLATPQEKKEDK